MRFSGKMWLAIILKVTKQQGFTLSLENKFLEKPQGVCITASGNILACGNISLKLFMAPLETIKVLTFWYVVAEHPFAQL